MVADRIPLPFKIFSGEGGTDLDIKVGLIKGGMETAEEEEVAAVVVAEFILTLAPSAFTRLGIFSKLTTGTGTLKNKGTHMHAAFFATSGPLRSYTRYHYQNTSLSLIHTPPVIEQRDSLFDGREICAV